MLLPADAVLAARDPDIPGLRVVLDGDAIACRLADAVPGLLGVEVTYLRYKPATSVVAGLVLTTPDGPRQAQAAAYHPAIAPHKLAKLRSRAAYVDSTLGFAVAAAEDDRRLPGIRLVAKQPGLVGAGIERVRTLRYNPGRRWVGVAEYAGVPQRLVKAHAPRTAETAVLGQRRFAAAGLPVPTLRLFRARHGLVAFDWVPGQPLDELPADACVGPVGELLARVHRTGLPSASGSRSVPVRPAVRAIAAVVPEAGELAAEVAAQCERWWHSRSGPITLLHGDLSADQIIVGPDGPWLTDLDRAGYGDPAADLGSHAAAEVVAGRAVNGCTAPGGLPRGVCRRRRDRRTGRYRGAHRRGLASPGHRTVPAAGRGLARTSVVARLPRRRVGRGAAVIPAVVRCPHTGEELRVGRVRPRGTDHALLELVRADGSSVAGQWFGGPERLWHVARATPWPAFAVPTAGVLIQPDGADRRLRALASHLRTPGARLVAHQPERRAMVALADRYVKMVRPGRSAAIVARGRIAAAAVSGWLSVPSVLTHDPDDGVITWSPLPGRTLHRLGSAAVDPDVLAYAWERLGRGLARLHATTADVPTTRPRTNGRSRCVGWSTRGHTGCSPASTGRPRCARWTRYRPCDRG